MFDFAASGPFLKNVVDVSFVEMEVGCVEMAAAFTSFGGDLQR